MTTVFELADPAGALESSTASTDDIDKSNSFYVPPVRVVSQGRDDFALAQADGERGDATEVESGVVS